MTGKQLRAADLLADGGLTSREIAKRVGVSERTLRKWKELEAFRAEVERFMAEAREQTLKVSIVNRQERLKRLDKRWRQIDRIFEQRAADPHRVGVPGYDTGLLCHEQKSIGSGALATVIEIYKADIGLLREEREIAKQAAIEEGQWQEKTDVTSGGKPIEPVVFYLPNNGRDSDSPAGGASGGVP